MAQSGEISQQLEQVVRACVPEDTFVVYFSGHSLVNDGLQLVVGKDEGSRADWIAASLFLSYLKDCAALSKLWILDSCRSGNAARELLPPADHHLRVMTATDGVRLAPERAALGAGVFTYHLHHALTDTTLRHSGKDGVLDDGGNLSLERVHRWLVSNFPAHALCGEPALPEPQLYGGIGQDILFGVGLGRAGPSPVLPPGGVTAQWPNLQQALADLFAQHGGCESQSWGKWIERGRLALTPALDSAPSGSDIERAYWLLGHTHEHQPLAYSVLYYAQKCVQDKALKEQIGTLSVAIQEHFGLLPEACDEARRRIDDAWCKTALVLRVSGGEAAVFDVEALEFWHRSAEIAEEYKPVPLGDDGGTFRVSLSRHDSPMDRAAGVQPISKLVDQILASWSEHEFACGLEVVLPERQMAAWELTPEAWEDSDGQHLGCCAPLVLRSQAGFTRDDRFRDEHWRTILKRRGSFERHAQVCSGCDMNRLRSLRNKGKLPVLGASEALHEQIHRCIKAGLSVALWLRREITPNGELEDLTTAIGRCKVEELPPRLQALRENYAGTPEDPRFRIGLIMDNPLRQRRRASMRSPEGT